MRKTCIRSFAGCNFAMRRGAVISFVFAAVSFVFATNRAGGVRGRRSRVAFEMCLRGNFRGTSSALRNYWQKPVTYPEITFSCLREKFPPFRAHLAITELPLADRIAHLG